MNLTNEQRDEMFRRFPGLDDYIIRCELKNEFRYLEDNEYILNNWQKDRLEFLRMCKRTEFGSFWR